MPGRSPMGPQLDCKSEQHKSNFLPYHFANSISGSARETLQLDQLRGTIISQFRADVSGQGALPMLVLPWLARTSYHQKRAHPDLNQGPADLQSAALTTELCTHVPKRSKRAPSI